MEKSSQGVDDECIGRSGGFGGMWGLWRETLKLVVDIRRIDRRTRAGVSDRTSKLNQSMRTTYGNPSSSQPTNQSHVLPPRIATLVPSAGLDEVISSTHLSEIICFVEKHSSVAEVHCRGSVSSQPSQICWSSTQSCTVGGILHTHRLVVGVAKREARWGEAGARSRVAFVLVDGLGDVGIPSLGFKSPVEAATTPNLDALASGGVSGLMDPVEPGLGCGSDTAHLSLLGYNPRIYYRGRGAFESLGAGLAMVPGDIAFKSNFATIDEESGVVTSRRADRHFEEPGPILCAALNDLKLPSYPQYKVSVRYATEHRCGVVVSGPGLSGNISGSDPLKDNRLLLKVKPLDDTKEAAHTSNVVNELSDVIRGILRSHPLNAERLKQGKAIANVVLLRGCGIRIDVPTFKEVQRLRPCMVAPTKIIAGLGLSLGIDILEAPGTTGDYRTLLTNKATAIAKALTAPLTTPPNVFVPGEEEGKAGYADGYDFGFLHVKAIDDCGHDKAMKMKVKAFEAVDTMVAQLARLLWEAEKEGGTQYSICITGDHSTPVEYGDHSYEPVPFTICQVKDFVKAKGGEDAVLATDLTPFNLPQAADVANLSIVVDESSGGRQAVAGDSVTRFGEIAAARGCLGRFTGSEMMGVIKHYMAMNASTTSV